MNCSIFKQINIVKFLIILLFISSFLLIGSTNSPAPDNKSSNDKINYTEITNFYICEIKGIIDPPISNHLRKCLKKSLDSGYGLIILMDTPGGLEASMREIIMDILNTNIPVIVFVYPEGARAASAGVFITYASDLAAMGPSTSIGAAHPVNLGGEQQISQDMLDKVTNDSVSFIKNLAESRGRNADWAEKAVRESVSITAAEALELEVIDLTASNIEDLLEKIDGRVIEKSGKTFLINANIARTEKIEMSFISRFLHIIVNPNIAYILFIIGIFGIIYEFSQPGLGISGAIGALFLILGFYAFSILPINYAGLALVILAIILFILDIALGLGGILSIAGAASLLIGSFLLIDSDAPYLKIATSLIISASVIVSSFLIIVIRAVYKIHRQKPVTGEAGITGETAVVCQDLNPQGLVKVYGEIWKAVSEDGKKIKKGQEVKIISLKNLTLMVKILNKQNN
ncbi:MAG: nodulation protein NfeD [Actinobacteria bacterium]|nr:nodulation protein NfeD [Actinomycetota bacterium]